MLQNEILDVLYRQTRKWIAFNDKHLGGPLLIIGRRMRQDRIT